MAPCAGDNPNRRSGVRELAIPNPPRTSKLRLKLLTQQFLISPQKLACSSRRDALVRITAKLLSKMTIRVRFLILALAPSLAACSAPEPPKPSTFTVNGGRGSEFGNYAATDAGEVTVNGQRCHAWNWDRPISPTMVLRYRSASCPSTEFPGRYIAIDLGHSIVPLSESNQRFEPPFPAP
jgi:hypothetical protein